MKPTMKQLLKEWRENLNEHVTDEEHEHPHADESDEHHCGDESLNELDFSGPAVGTDADVYGERIKPPQNKSEAEDLLHDALLAVEQYLSLDEIEAIFAQLY